MEVSIVGWEGTHTYHELCCLYSRSFYSSFADRHGPRHIMQVLEFIYVSDLVKIIKPLKYTAVTEYQLFGHAQ